MIKLGYRDNGSIIHRLNPFCKLTWVLSVFVLSIIVYNPLFLALVFISTLPVVVASKLAREWASFMKLALLLCLLVIIVNVLVSNEGEHILVEAPFSIPVIGIPVITLEAIFFGFAMSIKLLAIMSAFTVLTLTIHPDDMMQSMIKLRLPYKSVLVTSLSTRFIPTLTGDLERITDAQRSRGVELDSGGLFKRVRGYMTVLIPLLSNSLDRTVQVAEAMESRAFGSKSKRTFYKGITLSGFDLAALFISFLPIALAVYMVIGGYGDYEYYPTVSGLSLALSEWTILSVVVTTLPSIVLLGFLKRRIDLD